LLLDGLPGTLDDWILVNACTYQHLTGFFSHSLCSFASCLASAPSGAGMAIVVALWPNDSLFTFLDYSSVLYAGSPLLFWNFLSFCCVCASADVVVTDVVF
jgi:hypothetical protein